MVEAPHLEGVKALKRGATNLEGATIIKGTTTYGEGAKYSGSVTH